MRLGRPSQYAVDGSGRDSYINQDNGGLYKAYEPAYAPNTGTFQTYSRKKFSANAQFETKRTQYFSNGSGRDAYVVQQQLNLGDNQIYRRGNGGFYPAELIAEYKNSYVESLRHYETPNTPSQYCRPQTTKQARMRSTVSSKKPDLYLQSQSSFVKDQGTYLAIENLRKSQERSVSRLSQPRRKQPKFPLDQRSSASTNLSRLETENSRLVTAL
ncbi:UNKNOWN [Stylonychia lemnae]|uniref:Uncharacterized protein n=1 Tax=Stylonychia lemnae TaxID=5949 RepID=A0A078AEJ7_STYLE|nr:UNKNOWN [Stylonychia lemnae]|eukprot:CDW80645.1 UNKNOWN [Stylonychia lemnae]